MPMDRSLFSDGPGMDFLSTRSSLRTTSRQSSMGVVAEEDALGSEPPADYLDADLASFGVGDVAMFNDGDEVAVLEGELVTPVKAKPADPTAPCAPPSATAYP